MVEEIFGPVLTVSVPRCSSNVRPLTQCFSQVYVFDDADYDKTLEVIDSTSQYALTGSMYLHSLFWATFNLTLCDSIDSLRIAELSYRPQTSFGMQLEMFIIMKNVRAPL
jgi:hypothetical protein